MILRSVELESFGRFKGQTFEFRRGMNLVIGPNEAGKSTLAEAVPAVLFGTQHLERYKTWGRNACSAALFFEGGGRTIQIRRNLLTDEVSLVEKDDLYHVLAEFSGKVPLRGRSAVSREYRALLESLLGVGDEQLFRATYFFGHHPQEWRGDELSQNLRTLVSGTAESDYAQILDRLLEEHFDLTCQNPWGRDKQKEREYERICQQLAGHGELAAVPLFVEIDNRAELTEQIRNLTAELSHDRSEYEKGQRYLDHLQRQAVTDPPEAALAGDSETTEDVPSTTSATAGDRAETGRLAAQLRAVGLPEDPPSELADILDEASTIRQELAALQQPYSILSQREKKVPGVPWTAVACVVVFCLAVIGVAWWQSFQAVWVAVAGGVVSAAALGWAAWRTLCRNKALAVCQEERHRLDREKLGAQSRQAALSEKCEALGLPSSPIDLVRLQKLVTAHRELLDRHWAGAKGEPCPDAAPAVADTPVPTPVAAEPASDVASKRSAAPQQAELEARMAAFSAGLKEKERRLQSLQRQLEEYEETHSATVVDPSTRNIVALQQRKRQLEERIAVLRKAINLLADAVEAFGRSHLVKLNEEAGRLFGKITGGRYHELKLDQEMLPSVKVDGRRWATAENFSRGTVDAIYLALRVALAKVRDDGRSLPLMLDDPFVHLDAKRLAKALNMVDLASADGQLILFSHNMDLGKRAARERWHVVPLDGEAPAAGSEEEGGDHAGQLHLL